MSLEKGIKSGKEYRKSAYGKSKTARRNCDHDWWYQGILNKQWKEEERLKEQERIYNHEYID